MNLFNMGQVANIRSSKASYNQAMANQRQASAALRVNLLSAFQPSTSTSTRLQPRT